MYLEHIDIAGFRGLNRLSLTLTQPTRRGASITGPINDESVSSVTTNTVLIGENAWGKSSLLDALTLLLSPQSELYCFKEALLHKHISCCNRMRATVFYNQKSYSYVIFIEELTIAPRTFHYKQHRRTV